uniref:Uncharacterized protein n=1 Tax=viral metagenome TaxID=1070528 RepID=A0A6M3LJV5_9ZZZZ
MTIISDDFCSRCGNNTAHEEYELPSPDEDCPENWIIVHKCFCCGFEEFEYEHNGFDEYKI